MSLSPPHVNVVGCGAYSDGSAAHQPSDPGTAQRHNDVRWRAALGQMRMLGRTDRQHGKS